MKRIIPLILLLAIFAGLGYFFLANDMAMTTLISQNKERICNTYNRAVKSLNSKTAYDYTIKTETYVDGKVSTESTKEIKIIYREDVISKIYAITTTNDGEVEVFYELVDGVGTTYVTTTPKGAEPERSKSTTYTVDEVLDTVIGAKPVFLQVGDMASKTTQQVLREYQATTKEDHAKTKSSIVMSFKPFYIGAKFKTSSTVDEVQNDFEAYIDVTGKLKKTSLRVGTDTNYTRTTNTFNNFNKGVKIYWKDQALFDQEDQGEQVEPEQPTDQNDQEVQVA